MQDNTIFTVLGAIGASIISLIIAPLVKGYLARQKLISNKKEPDKFKLSELEYRRIEKHSIFIVLKQLLKDDFKFIYNGSRAKLPQKIFIYQMSETFLFLENHLKEVVRLIGKHRSSNKEDVINQVVVTIIDCKPLLEEFIARSCFNTEVNRLFFHWFNYHWQWYSQPTKEIIQVQDSYFDMVNCHLIRTIDFIYAVRLGVSSTINDYNGDLERLLTDEERNFNFEKYKYLT